MNTYAGVPEDLAEQFAEIQTKAFELVIRDAMRELTAGKAGKYEAVVALLGTFVGEVR